MLHTETSSVSPGSTVHVHTDEGSDNTIPLLTAMLGNQKSGIDPALLASLSANGGLGGNNMLMPLLLLLFLGRGNGLGLGGLGAADGAGVGLATGVATSRDVANFHQWATANAGHLSAQISALSPQLCASAREITEAVNGVNASVLTTSCQTLRDMATQSAALTQTIFSEGARGRELMSAQHTAQDLNSTTRFHEVQQTQAAAAASAALQLSNFQASNQLQLCDLKSTLQAQLAACCCESKIQGMENTQKILDNASANTANIMKALSDQNAAALNLQISNQASVIAQLNTEKTISAAMASAFARYPAPVCNGGHGGHG